MKEIFRQSLYALVYILHSGRSLSDPFFKKMEFHVKYSLCLTDMKNGQIRCFGVSGPCRPSGILKERNLSEICVCPQLKSCCGAHSVQFDLRALSRVF